MYGKTASFLLPMIQHLLNEKEKNRPYFCVVVEPTRELASQVVDVLNEMSRALPGLSSCLLVGGMDVMKQSVKQMAASNPNCKCEIWNKAAHNIPSLFAKSFNEKIVEFVKDVG